MYTHLSSKWVQFLCSERLSLLIRAWDVGIQFWYVSILITTLCAEILSFTYGIIIYGSIKI